MNGLGAFVGCDFRREQQPLVRRILEYLAIIVKAVTWGHAFGAEATPPSGLAQKTLDFGVSPAVGKLMPAALLLSSAIGRKRFEGPGSRRIALSASTVRLRPSVIALRGLVVHRPRLASN